MQINEQPEKKYYCVVAIHESNRYNGEILESKIYTNHKDAEIRCRDWQSGKSFRTVYFKVMELTLMKEV